MAKISKKRTLKRGKKSLKVTFRGFILRHPWVVAVITFTISIILESAAEYYLSVAWGWLAKVVQSFLR